MIQPEIQPRTWPFARFFRETRASVATMFAFALLPMLIFTGAAIDYTGALALRAGLQNASDSTILALCQQPISTQPAQLQTLAQSWLGAINLKPAATLDPLVVTNNPRQISMKAHVTYPSTFGSIVGLNTIPMSTTAQCTAPLPKVFEVALVLDNTGSMSESSGSQTKIQALQQAATNFVNFIYQSPAIDTTSRVAIVPFASAVAVDPVAYRNANWIDQMGVSPYHWTNISGAAKAGFLNRLQIFDSLKTQVPSMNWGWAGCLESPAYPLSVQDGAPSAAIPSSLYVPYFSPDEPSNTTYYGYWTYNPAQLGNYYFGNNEDLFFNNYISDTNTSNNCASSPNEQTAMMQACKYVKPTNPLSFNNNTGSFGPNFSCNGLPLQRLTTSTSQLTAKINAMQASGNTNIHQGVMWGWRTLSPFSVFADGTPYGTKNTQKVIVLMTDGTNTWGQIPYNTMLGSYYSAYGYLRNADGSSPNSRLPPGNASPTTEPAARAAIDELTLEACTNAKNAGVLIYTIGFSIPSDPIDQQGLNLLQSCANNTSQAFVANDSSGLILAFNNIANALGALRLTQ